jgi:hypothetical protein
MDKPKLTVVEQIPTAAQEEIRAVIDVLERALAEAREGKILAVAIPMVLKGNKFGYYSSNSNRHMAPLISAVNLTNWRLCEEAWGGVNVQTEEFDDPLDDPA